MITVGPRTSQLIVQLDDWSFVQRWQHSVRNPLIDRCFHLLNFENAFSQGSGFIKDQRFHIRQRFNVVTSFNQDPSFTSATDSAKEAQRYGDHQSTRARNN